MYDIGQSVGIGDADVYMRSGYGDSDGNGSEWDGYYLPVAIVTDGECRYVFSDQRSDEHHLCCALVLGDDVLCMCCGLCCIR